MKVRSSTKKEKQRDFDKWPKANLHHQVEEFTDKLSQVSDEVNIQQHHCTTDDIPQQHILSKSPTNAFPHTLKELEAATQYNNSRYDKDIGAMKLSIFTT